MTWSGVSSVKGSAFSVGMPFPLPFFPDSVYFWKLVFICVLYGFYLDIQYECDNAFPNLKCIREPLFLEKGTGLILGSFWCPMRLWVQVWASQVFYLAIMIGSAISACRWTTSVSSIGVLSIFSIIWLLFCWLIVSSLDIAVTEEVTNYIKTMRQNN